MALSTSMREVIPLRALIHEIATNGLIRDLHVGNTRVFAQRLKSTKVYEDNQSCLILATTDQFRPRTKHIAIKWHHFKDQVRNGNVEVIKVGTKDNIADIFTKPLVRVKFEYLRKLLNGW